MESSGAKLTCADSDHMVLLRSFLKLSTQSNAETVCRPPHGHQLSALGSYKPDHCDLALWVLVDTGSHKMPVRDLRTAVCDVRAAQAAIDPLLHPTSGLLVGPAGIWPVAACTGGPRGRRSAMVAGGSASSPATAGCLSGPAAA